jgi:hypothetical protein
MGLTVVSRRRIRFLRWLGLLQRNRQMTLSAIFTRCIRRRSAEMEAYIASDNRMFRELDPGEPRFPIKVQT